jgi:hypothetical protein
MRNKTSRRAASLNRRAEASPKFVQVRRVERPWLLAGTAILGGLLAASLSSTSARAAMVACNPNPATSYTCAGPEDVAVSLIPSGNFQVDLGPNPAGNPFIQTVIDSNPALAIYAYGQNTINDGVVLYPNSSITNEDGIGMAILDPGQVDLNLWSNDEADPASIVGTTGLYIGPSEDGYGGQVHINNNGHIEGTDGAAIEATGGTYGSLIFELDNHSYQSIIGDGNGVDLTTTSSGHRSTTVVA